MNKNSKSKVYHFENKKNNKTNGYGFEQEFAHELNLYSRQLELEKEQINSFCKKNSNKKTKKDC